MTEFPSDKDPGRLTILADRFARVMKGSGYRLAVAESLTGGLLQATCSMFSGSTSFFDGGVTAYSLDQKVNILKVDRDIAEADDCVSAAVVTQMAMGVQGLFGSDVSLATTGYADKFGDIEPFFHFALALFIKDLHGRQGAVSTGCRVLTAGCRQDRQREAVCIVLEHAIQILEIT